VYISVLLLTDLVHLNLDTGNRMFKGTVSLQKRN